MDDVVLAIHQQLLYHIPNDGRHRSLRDSRLFDGGRCFELIAICSLSVLLPSIPLYQRIDFVKGAFVNCTALPLLDGFPV